MPNYQITTTVEFTYEFNADSEESAEAEGWKYEDYKQYAEVYSIEVKELESEEEDGDDD
jgi:hypothetical protein